MLVGPGQYGGLLRSSHGDSNPQTSAPQVQSLTTPPLYPFNQRKVLALPGQDGEMNPKVLPQDSNPQTSPPRAQSLTARPSTISSGYSAGWTWTIFGITEVLPQDSNPQTSAPRAQSLTTPPLCPFIQRKVLALPGQDGV